LESKLKDHFSSCGKIKSVCIPPPYYSSAIKSHAYIEILGECAKENALHLSGIEMDGHKLVVTAPLLPLERTLREDLKSAKSHRSVRKIIKRALGKHFSSCGEVLEVDLLYPRNRKPDNTDCAGVSIYGEGAKEKALQLGGSDMGGFKLVVEDPFLLNQPEVPVKPRDIPICYPPVKVRRSDPNWREKFHSRLLKFQKKEEEDPNWREKYIRSRILLLNVEENEKEDPNLGEKKEEDN
jgi:hypothetical protein